MIKNKLVGAGVNIVTVAFVQSLLASFLPQRCFSVHFRFCYTSHFLLSWCCDLFSIDVSFIAGSLCLNVSGRSLPPPCSIAHPYLLADNRHFTFYLWRRVISPAFLPALRYAWLPLYALSFVALWHALGEQTRSGLMFFSWYPRICFVGTLCATSTSLHFFVTRFLVLLWINVHFDQLVVCKKHAPYSSVLLLLLLLPFNECH